MAFRECLTYPLAICFSTGCIQIIWNMQQCNQQDTHFLTGLVYGALSKTSVEYKL